MSWLSDLFKGRFGAIAKSAVKTFSGKNQKEEGSNSFLNNILNSLGNSVGGGLANSLEQAIFGKNDRISQEQYTHYQNLLDQGNEREIGRQSSFLEGVAPSQAAAHNIIQDATYSQDTDRYQQRMDTLFAGTSPWERLGTSAASPLPTASLPGKPEAGGNFLSSLTPLAQANIQADTQRDVAKIQQQTAQNVAKIGQDTELQKAGMQTNNGQLPKAQTAETAAREFLVSQQAVTEGYRQVDLESSAYRRYKQTRIESAALLLSSLPEEQVDLGLYSLKGKKSYELVMQVLNDPDETAKESAIAQILEKLPPDDPMFKKTAMIAGEILQGTKILNNVAQAGGKFLGNMGRAGAKQWRKYQASRDQKFLSTLYNK